MTKIKKHHYSIYIISILGWLAFSKYQYGLREWSSPKAGKTAALIALVIVIVSSAIMIGVFERKQLSNLKKFALIYIFLSAIYFCALPMYREPDGIAHFARAYEISEGHMLSDINEEGVGGRALPTGLFLDMSDDLKKIPEKFQQRLGDERVFMNFWGASLYNPITYLPQATGIFLTRPFTDRTLVLAYAARLVNWLLSFILITLSIKYIPGTKRKILMMVIALLPMSIHQAVSLSSDGMVLALVFAITAFSLYMRYEYSGKMKPKHIIFIYCLTIFISAYKIVYIPICLLLFLIPQERFKSKKNYFTHVIVLGVGMIVSSLGWLFISSRYLIEINEGVDGAGQVSFVLHNLHTYLWIIIKTILTDLQSYYFSVIGEPLGTKDIHISFLIIIICSVVMVKVISGRADGRKIDNIEIVLNRVISVLIGVLIFTSLYIQWTPVGNDLIYGIQGRYFTPILFMLAFSLSAEQHIDTSLNEGTVLIPLMFANVCAGLTVFYACYL